MPLRVLSGGFRKKTVELIGSERLEQVVTKASRFALALVAAHAKAAHGHRINGGGQTGLAEELPAVSIGQTDVGE